SQYLRHHFWRGLVSEKLLTSEQIRAARALLRWEQQDLAMASGVSLPSVKRLETSPGDLAAHQRTIDALRQAFEAAGVEFTNGTSPGVKLTLFVRDGEKDGADYSFACRYRGREFRTLVAINVLDTYEAEKCPDQPTGGRMRRMTALVGAPVLRSLESGSE